MMDLDKKSIPHNRDRLFGYRSSTKTAHETSTGCEVELISYKNYVHWIKCIFMIN